MKREKLQIGELTFNPVDNELFREYTWGDGFVLRIDSPLWVAVSDSGGHRVMAADRNCYYVAAGWRFIHWVGKEDPAYRW